MQLKPFFVLVFSFAILTAAAQRPAPDQIKTDKGMLTVQPITHGTLVLAWNQKTIYVDPYNGAKGFEGQKAPDLVLITDIHPDHLDLKTLEALDLAHATLVVPPAVADLLPEHLRKKAVVLKNGDKTRQKDISIKAVPMYNLPESPDTRHPKGRGNGYVLELGDKKVYLAGDTEATSEMRNLDDIDVAFVPMNLPFTMDVDQAAEGVLAFKPKIVYPYHYRGKNGLSDVQEFKRLVNAGNKKIEVRLRNWYPEQ